MTTADSPTAPVRNAISARADECAATGRGCHIEPSGPNGERQCRYCGEPDRSDLELLLELAAADQALEAAIAHRDALKLPVDVAFATREEMAPARQAAERVRAAQGRRAELLARLNVEELRARLLTPIVDLDRVFMERVHEAVAESTWMPKDYVANDWQADVLAFLRHGPGATTP